MAREEIKAVRAFLAANAAEEDIDLAGSRARMDAIADIFPVPDGCLVEDVDAYGVHGLWIAAKGAAEDKVILYLHGGGYSVGSSLSHRHLTAALSAEAEASVLSIDYRMAPEFPYPAAVEDAVAAYKWLLEAKGIAPNKIMISGDSAGGGLAMATLLMLRDRELGEPAGGMVISPWVDLTGDAKSMETRAGMDPMVGRDGLRAMADAYLAGKDATSHLASPVFARLDGLPPLLIQVGTDEVLYDDSLRLAGNAVAAHVDVTLEIWDDMIHVWHTFFPMLQEGRDALAKMGDFFKAKTK